MKGFRSGREVVIPHEIPDLKMCREELERNISP